MYSRTKDILSVDIETNVITSMDKIHRGKGYFKFVPRDDFIYFFEIVLDDENPVRR